MGNVAKAKSALVQLSLAILVAVTALFAQATPALAADGSTYFTDVHEDDWFNADVGYAYERGILLGTDDDTFSPLEATSRGMVVTVLYRFEGKPSPSAKSTFPDVDQDEFYADAVAWGEEVGVVAGFDDGLFRPNDPVTREQLAVFLQRYAEFKGYDAEAEADLSDFSDEDEVSAFAQAAVEWANANGLIRGLDDGRLAPRSNASRAEFAAILNRFFKAFVPDSLTVTFDLGYGDDSVYAKTIVEDGKTVERPDEPVRSGYDFVGWYTAKTGGEKFDFDSAITKDVTLYARWSARSNPQPTPEYTVTFNSNEGSEVPSQKVLKGECATEPEAPTKDGFTFEGWFSDEALTKAYDFDSPVTSDITLYAKWESSASDGVYTAQYTVSSDANADITFDARAVVGTNTVKTNEVVIFAYYELTDEQIALMDEVEAGISQVMKQADESLPEGASNDDRTQARFDAVMNYLQSKTEEGVIEALSGEREGGNISFSYTETGIGGGAMCDDSAFESGTEIKGSSEPRGTAPADIMMLSSDTTGINYISYHEKALVLHYYAENEGWSGQYLPTTNTLSDAGFDTTHRYSATINDYKSLKGYQFVMVDSHGSTYAHWFTTTPVICTNEGVTSDNQKSYSSDLFKNRIVKVGGKYWIRPDFFTFYYDQGHEMNCEIFHLAICKGAYGNTRLVDAINDAGANAVIAYTDTVTVGYDIAILQDALSTLLEGNSISNSLAYAKSQNGNQDPSTGAVPNYYGSGSAKIHSDLRNGNFDNVWDYLSDGISFWEEYGDARSIFKLVAPNEEHS